MPPDRDATPNDAFKPGLPAEVLAPTPPPLGSYIAEYWDEELKAVSTDITYDRVKHVAEIRISDPDNPFVKHLRTTMRLLIADSLQGSAFDALHDTFAALIQRTQEGQ